MLLAHKLMLKDRVRCLQYQKAIRQAVKPTDIVCDIGTGSGLLAFFSLQAGAKKVYAIERTNIIDDAKKIARDNGWDKKIVFIKNTSTKVSLPQKVDIIVSELIGFFALEEDLLKYILDAKRRFLKKGGIIIPYQLEMFLAPIQAAQLYRREINSWPRKLYGIDFSAAKEEALNSRYIQRISLRQLLSGPCKIHSINFYNLTKPRDIYFEKSCQFIIQRRGILHGLAGWFQAKLAPGVILSTSPGNKPTHWKNSFFPLQRPLPVEKGDRVKVRLIAQPLFYEVAWSWKVEVFKRGKQQAQGKELFNHSTLKTISIPPKNILKRYFLKTICENRPILISKKS